jgi:hypothetical protein
MITIPESSRSYATLISIVPFPINENKPAIYPGRFVIPPCLNEDIPNFLEIGTSVHFIEQFNGDEKLPSIPVYTGANTMAHAIVNDYMTGQIGNVDSEARPGLACLEGKVSLAEFVTKHKDLHKQMKAQQLNWFKNLVKQADNDWNRHHNHKIIAGPQIFAAERLGLKKEWMLPSADQVPIKCPACLSNCAPEAVVCSVCRCILKSEEYKKMTFAA